MKYILYKFMKNINDFKKEKILISKDTKVLNPKNFTDKELIDDYNTILYAYTKSEKKEIADKYNITDLRIRPIQIEILKILREKRKDKNEFTKDDVINFFRFDIPETYNKMEAWLKEESNEFVEYLLEYYKERAKKIHSVNKSINDKHILRILSNIQKYLGHK